MFPAFPAHAQPPILRIWQEAHDFAYIFIKCMTIVTELSVNIQSTRKLGQTLPYVTYDIKKNLLLFKIAL